MRLIAFLLLFEGALAFSAPPALGAELKPETVAACDRYLQATEVRISKEESHPEAFLYFDTASPPDRREALATLKKGEDYIVPLRTLDASGRKIGAPGGLIHHWLGIVFIPGTSIGRVLSHVQDYNHHEDYYKPEVIRSRLVSRNGNDFKILLRFREQKVLTVTLDTDHDVRYSRVDATHWYSRTRATRIVQVEDAGGRNERELPEGQDGGYLWRMNTYWRFEERDGGVYVQCESISLTRDIPRGLGWLIEPFVTSIPRESLQDTLGNTRLALLQRPSSKVREPVAAAPPIRLSAAAIRTRATRNLRSFQSGWP